MAARIAEPERLKYVEASPDVQLHVLDQGSGRPIVLLPGWPFSNELFEALLPDWTAAGNRVIVPSLRGFGRSDEPHDGFSYDTQADDLKGLLEHLNPGPVVLFGHSMGAAVAIRYMSRHHGAGVSKLILCDAAAPVWTRRTGYPSGLSLEAVDELLANLQTDRGQVFHEVLKAFRFNDFSLTPQQNQWLYGLLMQASYYAFDLGLVEMRNGDLRPDLETISVPTAIFHGHGDRFCPFPFAQELSKGIKNSRVVRFEKSGHLPFLEEPGAFKSELLKFANENA